MKYELWMSIHMNELHLLCESDVHYIYYEHIDIV
jgi:hypothetical protein